MITALRVQGEVRTDTGRVREKNEDSVLARPDIGLWVVADGMGGHAHGQWASSCIVESLAEVPALSDFEDQLAGVADAIHRANARVYQRGVVEGQMGSTVVALLIGGDRFALLWAGDSRAYLLRNGALHRLTVDHTQVQVMVDAGLLTAEEAAHHPLGHVLARALGVTETVELDGITDSIAPDDRFLLCSDGLSGVVPEAEIAALLSAYAPDDAADALLQRCLQGGAPDNVTLAVVDVRQSTAIVFAERAAG